MEEKTISSAVLQMSVHMANLYYYLTKSVIEDFGEEAIASFERAITEFGHARGQAIREKVLAAGLPLTIENLDRFYDIPIEAGWAPQRFYAEDHKDNITEDCIFARVWMEKNWARIGQIYCIVDIAIREGYSGNVEFKPVKNILRGDTCCQSLTVYKDISRKGE